jgi:SP family arabinose:H+ symporter-like MFS transporter
MNKKLYLLLICFISTLGGFLFGYDTAVISGTLTFVRNQFLMESLMEGWFVGSALLGCVFGVALAGILADLLGRKKILILSSILLGVSAIGCMVSNSLTGLIFFRFVGGLGVGIASMLSPLYISEISPPEIRGRMVSLYQFAITIGILCAYFANTQILAIGHSVAFLEGSFWNWIFSKEVWRAMFGAETIPALVFFVTLFIVPETPRWLLSKDKEKQATKILLKLVNPDTAKKEIDDLKEVLAEEIQPWKQILQPGMRLAMFIGISLAMLSQFTGINAIIYYGPKIFESAGFTTGSSLSGQVVIGTINVLFTLIAIWKIDRLGRRVLLLIGCSGMMIAHIAIGILFQTGNIDSIALLIFMLTFIAFFAFSYGPVIWTLLSEIYPTNIRGRGMSIATFTLWLATYIVGQLVPWLFEHLKTQGTFWLFALMCLPAIFIVLKLVPETKGKTLEEIERYWRTK